MEKYVKELKEHDLKITSQRLDILSFLDENRVHPSADEIYRAIKINSPALSKTTIYNNIDVMVKNNIIKAFRFMDSNELRFDYKTTEHYHFICRKCKNIYDVDISLPYLEKFENYKHKVEEFYGDYRGICENCLKKEKQKNKK